MRRSFSTSKSFSVGVAVAAVRLDRGLTFLADDGALAVFARDAAAAARFGAMTTSTNGSPIQFQIGFHDHVIHTLTCSVVQD